MGDRGSAEPLATEKRCGRYSRSRELIERGALLRSSRLQGHHCPYRAHGGEEQPSDLVGVAHVHHDAEQRRAGYRPQLGAEIEGSGESAPAG